MKTKMDMFTYVGGEKRKMTRLFKNTSVKIIFRLIQQKTSYKVKNRT
jgi:hypothetical protein